MEYRIEKDTIGEVKVPSDKLWGAQTERSRNNFRIGASGSMPIEIIHSYAILKKAAAITNNSCGILSDEKMKLIALACDEIVQGKQSSNDTFPTAMHMAAYEVISNKTIPALNNLLNALNKKTNEFKDIVKIGRTHLMDATPITLGQEFSAFSKQIENGIKSIEDSLKFILEIAFCI